MVYVICAAVAQYGNQLITLISDSCVLWMHAKPLAVVKKAIRTGGIYIVLLYNHQYTTYTCFLEDCVFGSNVSNDCSAQFLIPATNCSCAVADTEACTYIAAKDTAAKDTAAKDDIEVCTLPAAKAVCDTYTLPGANTDVQANTSSAWKQSAANYTKNRRKIPTDVSSSSRVSKETEVSRDIIATHSTPPSGSENGVLHTVNVALVGAKSSTNSWLKLTFHMFSDSKDSVEVS